MKPAKPSYAPIWGDDEIFGWFCLTSPLKIIVPEEVFQTTRIYVQLPPVLVGIHHIDLYHGRVGGRAHEVFRCENSARVETKDHVATVKAFDQRIFQTYLNREEGAPILAVLPYAISKLLLREIDKEKFGFSRAFYLRTFAFCGATTRL